LQLDVPLSSIFASFAIGFLPALQTDQQEFNVSSARSCRVINLLSSRNINTITDLFSSFSFKNLYESHQNFRRNGTN
jgi:hypothetical protein